MTKCCWNLSPEQKVEIAKMYEEGYKLEYIAALFAIRRQSVYDIAIRRGVTKRKPNMNSLNVSLKS